jgi:DNA-directed RNA polymerase II subunit RPB1
MVQLLYGEDGYDSAFLLTHDVSKIKVRSPIYIDRILDKFPEEKNQCSYDDLQKIDNLLKNECENVKKLLESRRRKLLYTSPDNINKIYELINVQLRRAYIKHGEMVGTLSAQCIGEPTTQLALNSFHFSGISAKTMTLGVPRFKEIINVAKNIKSPSMTLPLLIHCKDKAESIACSLEYTLLSSIIDSYEILPTIDTEYSKLYEDIETLNIPFEYMVRFYFNRLKILEKRTSLFHISCAIMKEYYESLYVTICNENEDRIYIDIRVYDDSYNTHIIEQLATKLTHSIFIHGNDKISKTYISENNDRFIIETDGSCLQDMLVHPYIDSPNAMTNDSTEIYEVLGIEAARASLMTEIKQVIEYDGGYVNYRHFSMLVDTMTHKGYLMSITRHGINKTNTGPLMKCSFEETVDVLLDAAQFGEIDKLQGVTETITVGKLSNLGTANINLIWNPSNPVSEEVVETDYDDFLPATPPGEEAEWETSVMFTNHDVEESFFSW